MCSGLLPEALTLVQAFCRDPRRATSHQYGSPIRDLVNYLMNRFILKFLILKNCVVISSSKQRAEGDQQLE